MVLLPSYVLLNQTEQLCLQTPTNNHTSIFSIDHNLTNLTFSPNKIYHYKSTAYDYYSIRDLEQSRIGCQWNIWPLPDKFKQNTWIDHSQISPFVVSKLPFVDAIYVMTDRRLTQRHDSLRRVLLKQGISNESVQWRWKWNFTTCNSPANHLYVYQRLNLKNKPLG